MSGICGIVQLDGAPVAEAALHAMIEAAPHRGDGEVGSSGQGTALAYQALAAGRSGRQRQPLQRGAVTAVIDCRVDNAAQLKRQLSPVLQSDDPTDAELVFAAYRQWGTECAARILGDFAIAIWDQDARRLFLARDAFGMRPLYYRIERNRLLFASEVKQLLAAPGVPRRIFEPAVAVHLATAAGRPEWSFYSGIDQLPAAHALIAGSGQRRRAWRYWEPGPGPSTEAASDAEWADGFREVFIEAVRARLRGYDNFGIFLSGGLDSSSIAATAGFLRSEDAQTLPRVHAYCFAFDELRDADERHISDHIVRRYGLHKTDVPADDAWPLKHFPDSGPDQDDPVVGAFKPLHDRVLAIARQDGLQAVMTGHHGDYMTGGNIYGYIDQLISGDWGGLRRNLRHHSAAWGVPVGQLIGSRLVKPLLRQAWPPTRLPAVRATIRSTLGRPSPWAPWICPDFAQSVSLARLMGAQPAPRALRRHAQKARYQMLYSAWERRGVSGFERNWARFGLSFVDPWADRRILEYVLAAPASAVSRAGTEKLITRRAMKGIIPDAALRAAGKITPRPLYLRGMRQEARGAVRELLTDMRAADAGYVDERTIRAHYEQTLAGGPEHDGLYTTLTLEWWLRAWW